MTCRSVQDQPDSQRIQVGLLKITLLIQKGPEKRGLLIMKQDIEGLSQPRLLVFRI